MVTQYDDKGKIFTQVVSKRPVRVIIQTVREQIHGTIYVRPEERVIDELNTPSTFIAVTDARVNDEAGAQLYACEFLTLNKEQVVWIIPDEEIQPTAGPA